MSIVLPREIKPETGVRSRFGSRLAHVLHLRDAGRLRFCSSTSCFSVTALQVVENVRR